MVWIPYPAGGGDPQDKNLTQLPPLMISMICCVLGVAVGVSVGVTGKWGVSGC